MKLEKNILGKRICLRNYEESDLTFLTDMWFDAENGKYLSDPTKEYVDEIYQKALDTLSESAYGYNLVIELVVTGERIGSACMFPDKDKQVFDIGYCIHKTCWNQGYGSETVALLCEWLRENGAKKVTAEVATENATSNRLLRKLGFTVEKKSEFKKHNMDVQFDSYIYAKEIEMEKTSDNQFQVNIGDVAMDFVTEAEVFSPHGADRGTLAMLSVVKLTEQDKLLDLGCGYGLVGIWAAKQIGAEQVAMCDISETAVRVSKKNCERNGVEVAVYQSDGLKDLPQELQFTKILSNPPYHEDFSVPKGFIELGYKRLLPGGVMYMVTKRKDWYYNKLKTVFGGVRVEEIDGYYVFTAEKRERRTTGKKKNEQIMSKKLQRKMSKRKQIHSGRKED